MITSKHILALSEDYYKSLEVDGKHITVYKNPGSSDIIELYKSMGTTKEFRYIADAATQRVFVWDAYLAVHRGVIEQLGYYNFKNKPYLAWGFGDVSNGRLLVRDWDYDRYDFSPENILFMRRLFFNEWDWLNAYLVNWKTFLSARKAEYEKYLK